MMKENAVKTAIADLAIAIIAGIIVGVAYYFFQNSNGFAPGGVGGLATIAYYLFDYKISWSILMIAFNLPIFVLVSALVNKKLGAVLTLYMLVQSFVPKILEYAGARSYSQINNAEDFNVIFAAIATGVISGFGFSLMLRRFGASGGTYGISALIRKARPETNIAYVSFIMDSLVVFVAFFVYGMKMTPVMCTLINLFIANIIVDHGISGLKNGYKFSIITESPDELSEQIIEKLKRGVTRIEAFGTYSGRDKYMLVCIINKRQVGDMMKIIKSHPDTFASFEKVNEVFGNFRRNV